MYAFIIVPFLTRPVQQVQLPGKQNIKLRIRVWGEVSADAEAKNKLHVTFTGWGFAIVRDQQVGREMQLPLPRPRGTLNTTFCDDTLRVSRGGRGGLFITNRAPSSH